MTAKQHSVREILVAAQRGGYAIGAFNVSTLSMVQAVVAAAEKLRSPVILETSPGETNAMGAEVQAALVELYEQDAKVPLLLNLDHARTYADVKVGLDAGYDMLHFDGSLLPLARNVSILKRIVAEAHRKHLFVEGEIDHITGRSEWFKHTKVAWKKIQKDYTKPMLAARFAAKTGIDIFAPFFGNVHGVFQGAQKIDFPLLKKIRAAVPCFLSMHGGSGTRPVDFKRAIRVGNIVKVNVSTDLRIAYTTTLRRVLARHRNEVTPYKLLPPVAKAVQRVVEEKIKIFGSAGKA